MDGDMMPTSTQPPQTRLWWLYLGYFLAFAVLVIRLLICFEQKDIYTPLYLTKYLVDTALMFLAIWALLVRPV